MLGSGAKPIPTLDHISIRISEFRFPTTYVSSPFYIQFRTCFPHSSFETAAGIINTSIYIYIARGFLSSPYTPCIIFAFSVTWAAPLSQTHFVFAAFRDSKHFWPFALACSIKRSANLAGSDFVLHPIAMRTTACFLDFPSPTNLILPKPSLRTYTSTILSYLPFHRAYGPSSRSWLTHDDTPHPAVIANGMQLRVALTFRPCCTSHAALSRFAI